MSRKFDWEARKREVLLAINGNVRAVEVMEEELRNDRDFVLEVVKKNGATLKWLPWKWRGGP